MKNRIQALAESFKTDNGPYVWYFREMVRQPKAVAQYRVIYDLVKFGAICHSRLTPEEEKTIVRAFGKWNGTDRFLCAAVLAYLYELVQLDKVDKYLADTFPKPL